MEVVRRERMAGRRLEVEAVERVRRLEYTSSEKRKRSEEGGSKGRGRQLKVDEVWVRS